MQVLVLRMSRLSGLAPYGSLEHLRLSRSALLYGYLLHLALSVTTLYLMSIINTSALGFSATLLSINMIILEVILWISVVRGPKNLNDILFVFKRVKKICRVVKHNDTKDAAGPNIRWMLIFLALVSCVSLVLRLHRQLINTHQVQFVKMSQDLLLLYDVKRIFVLFVIMQFAFMATKVNCAIRGVNKGLQELYVELSPDGGLDKHEKHRLAVPKDIMFGVGFINVKPKLVANFDHLSAHRRLRTLACAYVSTCDVARRLGDAAGLLLLLLVSFNIMNIIHAIYFIVLTIDPLGMTQAASIVMYGNWFTSNVLYMGELILLVSPCHDFLEELENTRYLVSHLSCEASSCTEAFRAELDVFFIHLKAHQPHYTALGMCALGRPLLLKVAAFVLTYCVLLLGF